MILVIIGEVWFRAIWTVWFRNCSLEKIVCLSVYRKYL